MSVNSFLADLQAALDTNLQGIAARSGLSLGHLSGLARGHKQLARPSYERLREITPLDLQVELDAEYEARNGQSPVLHNVRDLRAVAQSPTGPPLRVRFTGLITATPKKTKRYIFWTLRDDTDAIDCFIEAAQVGVDTFDLLLDLRRSDRVFVEGVSKHNRGGDLIVAVSHAGRHGIASGAGPYMGAHVRLSTNLARALYVPRLEHHFRTRFVAYGYVEVSSRLAVTEWPSRGVYPLQVTYDGFGGPFAISPSPIPQLVDVVVNSAMDRVFAIAPCFTQTYRDPHVSTEFRVLSAAGVGVRLEGVLRDCHKMILDLYSSGQTAPLQSLQRVKKLRTRRSTYPPAPDSGAVTAPEIQLLSIPRSETTTGKLVARLCWPVASDVHPTFREYVLVEGHSEVGTHDDEQLTVFTVNLERLLALLLAEVDVRRIPGLAAPVVTP